MEQGGAADREAPDREPSGPGVVRPVRQGRWLAFAAGAPSVLLGVAILGWPEHPLRPIAVLAGIALIVAAAASAGDAVLFHRRGAARRLVLTGAAVEAVAGVLVATRADLPVERVVLVAGAALVVAGTADALISTRLVGRDEDRLRWGRRGAFAIVGGLLLLAMTGRSVVMLASYLGTYFTLWGALLVAEGVMLGRSLRVTDPSAPASRSGTRNP
jgi:uncharacterized membrane protein HdeD (DUF308 family)